MGDLLARVAPIPRQHWMHAEACFKYKWVAELLISQASTHLPSGCFCNVIVLATVVLGFRSEAAAAAARRPPRNQRRSSKQTCSPFPSLHTVKVLASITMTLVSL
jgi:hypothetical protein